MYNLAEFKERAEWCARSLVYADDLKARLLNYIHSTVAFSEAEVDFNVVTWNRSV